MLEAETTAGDASGGSPGLCESASAPSKRSWYRGPPGPSGGSDGTALGEFWGQGPARVGAGEPSVTVVSPTRRGELVRSVPEGRSRAPLVKDPWWRLPLPASQVRAGYSDFCFPSGTSDCPSCRRFPRYQLSLAPYS